jgi:hypothetical protein
MIEKAKIYPITILSSLTKKEKQFLIDKNIIICRQLLQNYDLVTEMKLSHKKNIKLKKELHDILNIVL